MSSKLIFIIAIALALFFILKPGPYDRELHFNNAIYTHVKKVSGGDIANYFYTVDQKDIATANDFIQIIEFKEETSTSNWAKYLNPLLGRYKLKPIEGKSALIMFGSLNIGSSKANSYATPITIKGQEHFIIHVSIIANSDQPPKPYEISQHINALEYLGTQF